MNKTITYQLGAIAQRFVVGVPRGEPLTLQVAVVTSTGEAADLTGYHVVLSLDIDPSSGNPESVSATGDAAGISVFHTHGTTTAQWPDLMQFEVWLSDDANTDDPIRIVAKSVIRVQPEVSNPVPLRVYYGAAAAGLTGATAIEAALSHVDTVTGGFDFDVSPSGEKLYYAAPVVYGLASATYEGASFDELTPRVEQLHDQNGNVIPYYLHESSDLFTEA